MAQKLEVVNEVKCCADKFYGMFCHDAPQLPNHLPKLYQSLQIIGGGEFGFGTCVVWKFIQDGGSVIVNKGKITAINKNNRSLTCSVVEGDLLEDFKSFDFELDITPKTDGASLVKWCIVYVKANEKVPNPTGILKTLERSTMDVNLHLLKQA
ncbi:hypothetical protein MKX01_031525 [Papaver californicum]|nr:hypothetical protein MKX01_031525 [Papaver californicum]